MTWRISPQFQFFSSTWCDIKITVGCQPNDVVPWGTFRSLSQKSWLVFFSVFIFYFTTSHLETHKHFTSFFHEIWHRHWWQQHGAMVNVYILNLQFVLSKVSPINFFFLFVIWSSLMFVLTVLHLLCFFFPFFSLFYKKKICFYWKEISCWFTSTKTHRVSIEHWGTIEGMWGYLHTLTHTH